MTTTPRRRRTRTLPRRTFLRRLAGWAAAALAVGEGAGLARPSVRRPLRRRLAEDFPFSVYVSGPLRPPGAVAEALFRRRCTGCFL
ncbi:MAG: hypothetical protein ACE5IM_11845, partial [Nitrospinota bacterium]